LQNRELHGNGVSGNTAVMGTTLYIYRGSDGNRNNYHGNTVVMGTTLYIYRVSDGNRNNCHGNTVVIGKDATVIPQ